MRQLPVELRWCKLSQWLITFEKASIDGLASSSITCDDMKDQT